MTHSLCWVFSITHICYGPHFVDNWCVCVGVWPCHSVISCSAIRLYPQKLSTNDALSLVIRIPNSPACLKRFQLSAAPLNLLNNQPNRSLLIPATAFSQPHCNHIVNPCLLHSDLSQCFRFLPVR